MPTPSAWQGARNSAAVLSPVLALRIVTDASLAARYESLIRMAEAVRSHRDQRELFDLLARELRRVVPFDAIAQYDDGPRKVRWHLCADDSPEQGPKSDPTSDPICHNPSLLNQARMAVGGGFAAASSGGMGRQ